MYRRQSEPPQSRALLAFRRWQVREVVIGGFGKGEQGILPKDKSRSIGGRQAYTGWASMRCLRTSALLTAAVVGMDCGSSAWMFLPVGSTAGFLRSRHYNMSITALPNIGTTSGGTLQIRRLPASTASHSAAKLCSRSRVGIDDRWRWRRTCWRQVWAESGTRLSPRVRVRACSTRGVLQVCQQLAVHPRESIAHLQSDAHE